MNNKNEHQKLESNTLERSFYDYIYTHSLPKKVENFILKFHQASTYLRSTKNRNDIFDKQIYPWLNVVENTDVEPEYFEREIKLEKQVIQGTKGSSRNYNLEKNFTFQEISALLNGAFGRDTHNGSKKYGSAGALYPVIPIMLVFNDFSGFDRGVYIYNSHKQSLMKIKTWSEDKTNFIKQKVCVRQMELPNTCIAYAVDIRRAILKYHILGYRHALIEVGAMSQAFKHSLHQLKEGVGEISWSGFNDNQLCIECGLNVRLCPIMLLQWFGHTH